MTRPTTATVAIALLIGDPSYRGNYGLDRLEEVKAKFLESRQ